MARSPWPGFGAPGDNDRGGPALVWLGLVGSILVHLFLVMWAAGLFFPGPELSRDDVISVQLVPPEKAPPPPRSPPEATMPGAAAAGKATSGAPARPPAAGKERRTDPSPNAGDSLGKADSLGPTELSRDELDRVIAQAKFCWNIPPGWTEPRQVSATIRFLLNRDGTLRGRPVVVEFPANTLGMEAAENAVLAIIACSPFALPAEKYEDWRDMQLRFEP